MTEHSPLFTLLDAFLDPHVTGQLEELAAERDVRIETVFTHTSPQAHITVERGGETVSTIEADVHSQEIHVSLDNLRESLAFFPVLKYLYETRSDNGAGAEERARSTEKEDLLELLRRHDYTITISKGPFHITL